MEKAKVQYIESDSVHTHKTPSYTSYTFKYYTHDEYWVSVDNIEDARYFDDHESFVVKWTPAGRISRAANGTLSSVSAVLDEMGYREKQQLAKDHGIKANQSEEDLNEELGEIVEELAQQMEFQ